MGTQNDTTVEELRSRVEALGHRLLTLDTWLYIADANDHLVLISNNDGDEDLREVKSWLDVHERGDAEDEADHDTPAADAINDASITLAEIADAATLGSQTFCQSQDGVSASGLFGVIRAACGEIQAKLGDCIGELRKEQLFFELVVCAGARDRFKAMEIRKAEGLQAAIEFIGDCNVTQETR